MKMVIHHKIVKIASYDQICLEKVMFSYPPPMTGGSEVGGFFPKHFVFAKN